MIAVYEQPANPHRSPLWSGVTRGMLAYCLCLLIAAQGQADVLGVLAERDEASAKNVSGSEQLLLLLAPLLNSAGIDVLSNLNNRSLARGRVDRPRLGELADLKRSAFPETDELLALEQGFVNTQLSGIALLGPVADNAVTQYDSSAGFLSAWLSANDAQRFFVTIASADANHGRAIAAAAEQAGLRVLIPDVATVQSPDDTLIGRFFATSRHRLSLDSEAARDYDGALPDLAWLGARLRRNSESIFRDRRAQDNNRVVRSEPAVFTKESLGDEFSESTIREIVVPGGVALGETAALNESVSSVEFVAGEIRLLGPEQEVLHLPDIEAGLAKSLYDFAQRSLSLGSDSIVDIDADGRVRISAALRDTEAGYELMHADTVPFNYVSNLPVTKSVVIDNLVAWYRNSSESSTLSFTTEFEVRFLSADNLRLAQTRAALAYEYEQGDDEIEFLRSWGRDANRLRENLDYAGLGKEVAIIAKYAGWVGLWRRLLEDDTRFINGRYEFMKVDKTGRVTPSRYNP